MKFELWQLIMTAIGGSTVPEIIRFFFARKKDNAETEITLSDGWKDYADKLEKRLENLEREYWPLKEENLKLRAKVVAMELEMSAIKQQIA